MQPVMTKRNISGTRRALAGVPAGALAGLLAGAVALGVAELAAGITGPQGGPVVAVGGVAIDLTPIPVKDFAITHFGSHDKTVLVGGILVLLGVFAALLGAVAMRRIGYGLAGLTAFGALGVAAAVTRPDAGVLDAVPTLAGVLVAGAALVVLVRAAKAARPGTAASPAVTSPGPRPPDPGRPAAASEPAREDATPGRRGFLLASAGAAAIAVAGGGLGQVLLRRFSVAGSRARVRLPAAAVPAAPVPAAADLKIPGLTSFITPNASFYRVDTDLVLPQVSPETWRLRVHGMVDRELEISFDDLLRRPLTEADITLVCVSNEVGGTYNGNARWLGASLARLLREAGIRRGADQILSTSTDGMTISTPVDAVMDGRNALLAVGMNGQPLPVAHGFPARMVVPGLYGYVSATKWVTDLEITTFGARQAYWTQRGYAAQAPVKTESRIDVPKPLAQVRAGRTPVAGVAWAPHRGISAVQVSVDGGSWRDAQLAAADGIDTWRQWVWIWDANPGLHRLEARATDGTGMIQPSRSAQPYPDGASGWDSVVVTVN
jgi:DMSO/TMAO reductase YedYZ molybdopterin-dependent catalytic subunit